MYTLIHNNENMLLDEFLEKNYPEISRAIKKENYNLDILYFDALSEILFNGNVVGFMAFKRFRSIKI